MNRVAPQDLPQFLRRYRFPGGRIRAVRIRHSSKNGTVVEFQLTVREAIKDLGAEPKAVRLTLRVAGVEEFRFQMRPSQPKAKIADARLAYLNGHQRHFRMLGELRRDYWAIPWLHRYIWGATAAMLLILERTLNHD